MELILVIFNASGYIHYSEGEKYDWVWGVGVFFRKLIHQNTALIPRNAYEIMHN